MSQVVNRRTVVRGAAWSIPVVAVAANAPVYAASTDAPTPGSISVTCRTNGQGQGNCQGYRLVLTFNVKGTYTWNVRITTAQITTSTGVTQSINVPANFPYAISATGTQMMDLWFCSESSPSGMTLNLTYSVWRSDLSESTAVTYSFPQQVYPGGSIALC